MTYSLPAEYPFRPPSIMMLTPNGRFELNTKICISFTSYHEEMWQPAWGVRTAILGLQGFFPLKGQAAVGVGSIEYPSTERRRLAVLSRDWVCPHCQQPNHELLPDEKSETDSNNVEPSESSVAVVAVVAETEVEPTIALSLSPVPTTLESAEPAGGLHNTGKHSEGSLDSDRSASSTPDSNLTAPADPSRAVVSASHASVGPPLFLDAAIAVLLVLVSALICRRLV